jgi:hypothetical protein
MAENLVVVRVYNPDAEAKATVKELQRSGFAMNKLSIVGKDYHREERVIGGHDNAADHMKTWGELARSWGDLPSMLLGSGFYFIPGVGPVIVFGPLVSWIVRALENAVMAGELSALGAGLYGIGIPKHSIMEYETAVKFGKFIVIAHSTADDIAKANLVLERPSSAHIDSLFRGEPRQRA